jgi:hypothetical protein
MTRSRTLPPTSPRNGLLDPITIGVLNGERFLIDGRNRLKACGIASVAPRYDEVDFADEAALRGFVASRNERRNIGAGQRAMGHAMLFPDPTRLKRKSDFQRLDFSKQSLSNARTVLAHSPEIARAVRDGATTLSAAFEAVKAARERNKAIMSTE